MNTILTTPEVRLFVRAVRERLEDLTEEEREELVGGLDADINDLVEERGLDALPDPGDYARELRVAAGFSARADVQRPTGRRDSLTAWLDRGADTWDRWCDSGDHLGIPALLTSLRPVWWVIRAMCAAALLIEMVGTQWIFGLTLKRALLVAVFTLVSVQIGRRSWWPGTMLHRSLTLRLVLIALNLLAVLMVPLMLDRLVATATNGTESAAAPAYVESAALTFHGSPVRNVYPYDALGRPLVGVQLVDQDGRRLVVEASQYDDDTGVQVDLTPWMNGRTTLFSVFPLAEQPLDQESLEPQGRPGLLPPPFASLPAVTLPGVTPSALVANTTVEQKRAVAKRTAERKAAATARTKARKTR